MNQVAELEDTGRVWLRNALTNDALDELSVQCDVGERPGLRIGLSHSLNRLIGPRSELSNLIADFGVDAAPVRIVSFNKSAAANWSVPWHQDRIVAVAERREATGYANWVQKGDFWHCEAPVEVLRRMIFVRIHLDASNDTNGCLELSLGSHKLDRIDSDRARDLAASRPVEACRGERGDILVIKALTLHRSRSATVAANRRALRIDYARRNMLAPELDWAMPGFEANAAIRPY